MDYTRSDVAHLLRRVGFGGRRSEIDALMHQPSWAQVVEAVLDVTANPPDTIPAAVDDTKDEYYGPWVTGVQYWLDRMATAPTPVVEKLALFWHGHLTSAIDKVLMRRVFRQVKTLRAGALGNFEALVQKVAIDPAMLEYLDNESNIAQAPNENFARELMELFTLGNAQFAEADVIAMARAWTGHGRSDDGTRYQYTDALHDHGTKTLFGITKDWDGPAAIHEIVRGVKQPTCARFIAAKLWSFLAAPNPPTALADDLAAVFMASGMEVKALARAILLRPEFRAPASRGALVRSPIEWIVATMRAVGLTAAQLHPEWWIPRLGQELYNPPNVSGWRQNAYWISTSTMWGRGSFAGNVRWDANGAGVFAGAGDLSPAAATSLALDRFGIDDPSAATRQHLEHYVAGEQTADRRWAVPPGLVTLTMLTPEFQLA
ncbi:MAG: hypothetical protein JWN46_2723 [Acidimicrobiales bacterium]|nr:hypothetical protein [Acidimicrobiales bacterium]